MSTAWLNDLEEKVRQAAERLRELRAENEELRGRIGELEAELEQAGDKDEAAAAWSEERDDIRQRVETLVDHLEELLGDA